MTECTTTTLTTLTKQPFETRLFGMDFSNKMAKKEVIVSVDSNSVEPTGINILGFTITGQIVFVLCSGGIDTKQYKITVKVTTDSNQELENEGYLKVTEK